MERVDSVPEGEERGDHVSIALFSGNLSFRYLDSIFLGCGGRLFRESRSSL